MKKYLVHIIWLVVAIATFVGGMYYSRMTAQSQVSIGNAASLTRRGFDSRGGNGGGVAGQIVSKDSQSITVQMPNGNSEIVFYSSSTQVIKPIPGSINDLVSGANVIVGGIQNTDGSVTAQTIQVREGNNFGRSSGPMNSANGGQ